MNKKINILGIITTRGGSKGIPGKNIKILGSKPLIAYTIEVAQKSKLLTDLIASTDDKKIADICRKYACDVPFLRPKNLAKDNVKHLPVIQHATKFMEKSKNIKYDYIVILQPTSPFRIFEDIDSALKKMIKTKSDSAVTLVEWNETHPIKAKKFINDRVVPYSINEPEGIRRQDLEKVYKRNGSVYAMKRDLVMKKNKIYGNKICGIIIPKERSVDIDNLDDWKNAEQMLKDLTSKEYEL